MTAFALVLADNKKRRAVGDFGTSHACAPSECEHLSKLKYNYCFFLLLYLLLKSAKMQTNVRKSRSHSHVFKTFANRDVEIVYSFATFGLCKEVYYLQMGYGLAEAIALVFTKFCRLNRNHSVVINSGKMLINSHRQSHNEAIFAAF